MRELGGATSGTKMDYVKKSMWKMIEHMTEEDSLGIVFFDDRIETVEFRRMTSANKEVMRQRVADVEPRASTDIGSAILAAARMFAGYEGGAKSVERIMLLTDGEANMGAKEPEQFTPIISQVRGGVSLTCFGYGARFNEALLTTLSKTGKGNNYYIETPDNVAKVFAVELGGLLTCYAQDIVLSVKAHKGAVVANVLNDLDVETAQDQDGELVTKVKVGDIYAGEKRDVIIRLDFEKRPQALPRPVTLADVTLSYRAMSDAQTKSESSKVKVELVKTAAEATKERDADISEQVAIFEAANVMAEAKKMADAGDWSAAKQFIGSNSVHLRSMGRAKTTAYAASMDSFADSLTADYAAGDRLSKSIGSFAYSTSTSRGLHSVGASAAAAAAPATMNCVMSSLVDDFAGDSSVTVGTSTGADPDAQDEAPAPGVGYKKARKSC
jgi:Ca-activated chloride channel family protein